MTQKMNTKNAAKALEDKIETAIEKLESAGKSPTVAAIHEIVRGSYRELCPAVRAVKDRIRERRERANAAPEIPEAAHDLFATLWQEVWRLSEESLKEARAGYAAELEKREAQVEELEDVLAQVEAEQEKWKVKAETFEAEATNGKARIAELEKQLASAEARLAERDDILAAIVATQPKASQKTGKQKPPSSDPDGVETHDLPLK